MFRLPDVKNFLAVGATDMRKQVNGFCLWYKKLETGRFSWPMTEGGVLHISSRELGWLLDGLSMEQKGAHKVQKYAVLS